MGAAAMIYGALALLLTWPMALHIQTAIVGGGDAYHHLWGLWWFEKALGHPSDFWNCPLVFHPYGASLILDDWPLGPNLLALTARRLGFTLIGSYNASLLLAIWLNALSVFALVRAVVKEWLPAIVAGLFFAFSPFFWGRLHGHLAFVHAYPLALVALCAYKSQQSRSPRWAVGLGVSLALAVWSESYYAVYAAFYLVLAYVYEVSPVSLKIERRHTSRPELQASFLIVGLLAGIVAVTVSLQGGLEGPPGGVWGSVYRVARPMVIWWASWLVAFVLRYRLIAVPREKAPTPPWDDPIRFWGYAALPLILLLPVLAGVAQLAASGDFPALKLNLKPEFSGAYALSALFPNIYHSLWGHVFQHRLASWSLLERGSIGLGWAAIILVLGTKAHKVAGWWTFAFSVFLLLSFGPFLEIAPGLDQGPILPFWILRYVPVLSEARVPSRWIALALVAGSVLVGLGFQRIRSQGWKALAMGAIVFEGLVLPLRVVTPVVPALYQTIARDHQAGALLQLPFGACDGRGCWGDAFPAEHLYYQTVHQRPVVGGYLSRLSKETRRRYQDERILQQLVALQKNTDPSRNARLAAEIDGNSFLRWTADWGITWVMMDRSRASTALDGAVLTLLGQPLLVQGHVVAWRIGTLPHDPSASAD